MDTQTSTPDLRSYDVILVSSSAGKDSQAMLDEVYEQAKAAGVVDRIHVVHADLGRIEWEGTLELAREQAAHYNLPFHVVRRELGDYLDHVTKKGKWAGMKNTRYCTSDHKRDQIAKLVTAMVNEWREENGLSPQQRGVRQYRVLSCLGLRAQESKDRAKLPALEVNERLTNSKRHVDTWLPIHSWTVEQVWERIHKTGVRFHWAYDIGMPRLSCVFCQYATEPGLLLAGYYNRNLLAEYVEVEQRINHQFKHNEPLVQIQAKLDAGWVPTGRVADWTDDLCAAA